MSGLAPAFASLSRQWRENPRLRLGGWAVLAILALYLFLVLGDARQAWTAQVAEASERLERVRSLVGQDVWVGRAAEAAQSLSALEAEIPVAATPGLAQAAMQGRLRELVSSYGDAVVVEVAAASPVEGDEGWIRVPATLTAQSIAGGRALQLVQSLEAQPQLVVVQALAFDNREPSRLVLTVHGFFRLVPEQEPADGND